MSLKIMQNTKPRRNWGWPFIVALVIELIFFATVIGHDLAEAARIRHFAPEAANRLNDGVMLAAIVGVIVIGLTFVGAFMSFRKKQAGA